MRSPSIKSIKVKGLIGYLFLFVLFVIPTVAIAQTGDIGSTYDEIVLASQTEGDRSRGILEDLLTDFAVNPFTAAGRPDTLLGNLFFLFNSGIFIVGTALLSYFILASVAQTAHEGEVLGKRINGLWVPIRVTLGVFGMLPVFGGFSLAQAIVMWFVILGIGLANIMTSAAISDTEKFNALIPPPGNSTSSSTVSFDANTAKQLFLMNVCVDTASRLHEQATADDWVAWGSKPELVFSKVNGQTSIRSVGIGDNYSCGSFLLKKEGARTGTWGSWGGLTGWRSPAVNYEDIEDISNVTYAQKSAELMKMNDKMADLSEHFVSAYFENNGTQFNPPVSVFEDVAKAANEKVNQVVSAAIESKESAQDSERSTLSEAAANDIRKGGWMSLGSWHSVYAEVQAALQTAAFNGQLLYTPASNFDESTQEDYITLSRMMTSAGFVASKPEITDENSFGQSVLDLFFNAVVSDTGGTNMVNPITAAKSAGDWMITAGLAIYAVDSYLDSTLLGTKAGKWAVKGVSSVVSLATPIGAAISTLVNMLEDLISVLPVIAGLFLVIGALLSIYVPMIPFLTWVAALVSYFVSVIEGLIAAQVWAFGHLSLDGEGMGQKTEKGYQYLLSALIRPPLMVLGFFFASAILILIGTFVVNEMMTVVRNVQGDSMTGVIVIIAFFVLFTVLMITIVSTVFDMIFEVPDRVIAWFGNGLEARMARNMDSKIETQSREAARWAGASAATLNKNAHKRKNSNDGKKSADKDE
ncbi:DotA/TraY family protein [Neopusillimonas maritima]|uniref:DotA/TraY family protein n=1 Tax=Neopusillimonas maritima TaxID=2026239 RepID=A0A3A1YV57_9BURK|nr:DotA/TraY family protein [Neopusillimonas maritima]RIY41078.1 hypothetical protein CJP73_07980 [Neopusillimonas maritima]